MKRYLICLPLLLLMLLLSCEKEKTYLTLLTNDIYLFEIADIFNSKNEMIKVIVDYQDENTSFFSPDSGYTADYDIRAGYYDGESPLTSDNCSKLVKFSPLIESLYDEEHTTDTFYPLFKDFLNKKQTRAACYSIDFPVLIARQDVISIDASTDMISMEEFYELAKAVNEIDKSDRMSIGFIPDVSSLSELDFYFLFNAEITENEHKYLFDTADAREAFAFYYTFCDRFNFGRETSVSYLTKHKNIDQRFYLKKSLISFDFNRLSKALSYDDTMARLFLIRDLKLGSLKQKIITISSKSSNKDEAGAFVDYLLQEGTQEMLMNNSYAQKDYYLTVHIPVYRNIITKLPGIKEGFDDIDAYINDLRYISFIDPQIQHTFFKEFYNAKEMLNKGVIAEKDFLHYLSSQLNK